jgi:hypothetical protein
MNDLHIDHRKSAGVPSLKPGMEMRRRDPPLL